MLGTDLEKVTDDEIIVEIFPNRPDMLSEQGFARAFSSFIGVKTGLRNYSVKKFGSQLIVKDPPKEYPYAVACIVKGLKLDDEKIREIIQLQEKLGMTFTRNRKKGGLGLYPLEKIKFPISFTGKKPEEINFRPLEFPKAIPAKKILSQHPKGREYGHLIEDWKKYPVFVDSNGTIMSMPPIINSHDVGKIDEKTTDIFIEGTGPDLNIIKTSLYILATSLSDMGGQIYSLEIVYPKKEKFDYPDLTPRKMILDLDYVNKKLGLELNEKDIQKLLERMGYDYKNKIVSIPVYRFDILHPIDLVEDIAIAYGYENFKYEIPSISTVASESNREKFFRKVAEVLVGYGLIETVSYHLTNKNEQNVKMDCDIGLVELENALTVDYNSCRAWLIPCSLKVLEENKHNEYPQNIFEIGTCFKKDKSTETGIAEFKRLAVALCNESTDFTRIKQVLDILAQALDFNYNIEEVEHNSFVPGRVGRVSVNGKNVAYIGEIHPKVLQNFALEMPVAALELNLDDLLSVLKF